ncbi:MAG: hypothetical protein Q9190_003322 [Brigantiaea leucoxantha]
MSPGSALPSIGDVSSPSSILIIGAGVFGQIILVDPCLPSTPSSSESWIPNPNSSSIDTSRIIRPDYKNALYALLGAEAQRKWRQGFPSQATKVYWECGLCVTANEKGNEYVQEARNNVEASVGGARRIQGLKDSAEIRKTMGLEQQEAETDEVGRTGYVNWGSGWADAEGAMKGVMVQIRRLAEKGRKLHFRRGKAKRLLYEKAENVHKDGGNIAKNKEAKRKSSRIIGTMLEDGTHVVADLTVLATGAWTSSLLDLRGRVDATGQLLAYVPISVAEAQQFASMPVLLNLSTGFFLLPPARGCISPGDTEMRWHIKLARHAFGYRNPVPLPSDMLESPVSNSDENGQGDVVSLPHRDYQTLPPAAVHALRRFLSSLIPSLASRSFASTRICWYSDTANGDFIVDYHPEYERLFIATGGSGHAFKFLPVLGDKLLGVLERRGEEGLRNLWQWPEKKDGVWGTEDGSRGGERGLILEQERRRGGASRL